MIIGGVVSFPLRPVAPPPARAFSPSTADPLWRYPKAAESVYAVSETRRMDHMVVGGPIALWFSATVELMQFLLSHRRAPRWPCKISINRGHSVLGAMLSVRSDPMPVIIGMMSFQALA